MIDFSTQLHTAHTTHLHAQIVLRHVYVCLQSVHLQVLHVLQVALGGSDLSGTQAGDATGSLIHGHRFTMQQSRVVSLVSISHWP